MKLRIFQLLLAVAIMFINNEIKAQTGAVWVTINDPADTAYYDDNRKLTSSDSAFRFYINLLNIVSSKPALPASRNPQLQRVYELVCNCSQTELESTLSNAVPALSGIQPAPVYDTLHTPNDYSLINYVSNYALDLINAQTAWDITKGDSNVVIGIADQGYSANHSELIGKYNYFFSGSNTVTHGNAVSILAAGKTNNNNGLSSIGYDCKLWLGSMSYNAVLQAAYSGIKIINMSWSSGCFYNSYAQLAVDEAYSTGAFLVAAAGNGNTCNNGNPSSYVYPAAYSNVFSVTSIGPTDNHMRIPNDTTTTHQHNDKVDISAPGYDVAVNPAEGWFISSSGTSFAAPYVSGTVGLMLSANPCLSRKDIDTILRITAVNIDSINPLYLGKLGAGRLNAQAAVQLAVSWATNPMSVITQPMSVSVNVGSSAQFTASSTSSFPIYQWQYDSSGTFVNLVNNNVYSGVNTANLTMSNVNISFNSNQYRCVMTSGYCQAITDTAILTVSSPLPPGNAGPILGDSTLCYGAISYFTVDTVVNATGYNWVIGGNSLIISGQNTNTVGVIVYDSVVTITVTPVSGAGNGASASMNIYGIPPAVAGLTGDTTICEGDSAILWVNVSGAGPWSGTINFNIPFSGTNSPIPVMVSPTITTDYYLTELVIDSCYSGSDAMYGSPTVTVLPAAHDSLVQTICSSQLPYYWNGLTLLSSGTYSAILNAANGCDSIVTLNLTVVGGIPPAAPSGITQLLINNACFNRIYRYTAAVTSNANGYSWMIPASCGGIGAVIVDSGDINSSRIIRLKYTGNAAAFLTDSIKVRAYNNCGYGPFRAAKLINTALNVPVKPAFITVTVLTTNICGERLYRYKGPNLPSATAANAAATGYLWTFTNPVPLSAQIDSGNINSQTILVKYSSNAAAATGDSIYLQYSSDCGYSASRALKLNLAALNPPVAPATINVTALNVSTCGNRTYRFSMPSVPGATSTTGAATGYLWTFTGNLATYGLIDSGSLSSQVIVVKFTSDMASVIGDSIKAQFESDCGLSAFRARKFSVPKLGPPAAPSSISVTAISTNICGARKYRYRAPSLSVASTAAAAATGYLWDFTGLLGSNAVVDSGTLTSQVIRVIYSSNAAAQTGDSVRVAFTSNCGNSLRRAIKLTNSLLLPPAAPASIGIELKQDICYARKYRYIAPATLPAATATRGAASGYLWSMPVGSVGSTGTLDSGTLNSQKIVISYSSNAAASAGDSIYLRYTSACGDGDARARKLTNLIKYGCLIVSGKSVLEESSDDLIAEGLQMIVSPNPSSSEFTVQVSSKNADMVSIKLSDLQGRTIESLRLMPGRTIRLGAKWPAGYYLLELRRGKEKMLKRLLKL
jgi:hypothetical protein